MMGGGGEPLSIIIPAPIRVAPMLVAGKRVGVRAYRLAGLSPLDILTTFSKPENAGVGETSSVARAVDVAELDKHHLGISVQRLRREPANKLVGVAARSKLFEGRGV